MREFFNPWRRKLGCMTLGLACVLAAGWVRSFRFGDQIDFKSFHVTHVVESESGRLKWSRWPTSIRLSPAFRWQTWRIPEDSSARILHHYHDAIDQLSHMPNGESATSLPSRIFLLMAPYWSIVVPLTALSAHLLLSKSKSRATAPKATEPVPLAGE